MEFVPAVALLALVASLINFLKYLRAGDTNGALTQLCVWVGGIAAVVLVAQTDYAAGISMGDQALDTLNFASLIFIGLQIGGMASLATEFKKALDGGDNARKPDLMSGKTPEG